MTGSHNHIKQEERVGQMGRATHKPQLSLSSPLSYAEVPLSKSLRRKEASSSPTPVFHDMEAISPLELTTYPSPPSPQSPVLPRRHIPRPPNAFMIYRSDLIKSGRIPAGVEHRQQNISRLAGQCWNLLPEEDKKFWMDKAARALEKHKLENPEYKFTPAPRGSRRSKIKSHSMDDSMNADDHIRDIREKYVGVMGPSLVAPRRRRRKAAPKSRSLDEGKTLHQEMSAPPSAEMTPELIYSNTSSPSSASSSMTLASDVSPNGFYAPPCVPQITLPRRPSTSLGFIPNPTPSMHNQPPPTFANPFPSDARPPTSNGLGLSTTLQGLDMAAGLPDVPFPELLPHLPLPYGFSPGMAPTNMAYSIIANGNLDYPGLFAEPNGGMCGGGMDNMPRHFGLHYRGMSDEAVSPLDTSPVVGLYQMQRTPTPVGPYDGWNLVNNPSDDLNYAVDQAYLTPPPTASSSSSS